MIFSVFMMSICMIVFNPENPNEKPDANKELYKIDTTYDTYDL
jgi:hypothetical protein